MAFIRLSLGTERVNGIKYGCCVINYSLLMSGILCETDYGSRVVPISVVYIDKVNGASE